MASFRELFFREGEHYYYATFCCYANISVVLDKILRANSLGAAKVPYFGYRNQALDGMVKL